MPPVRLGAVSYLNARPLVVGLERHTDRFDVRYDLPSTCATLLQDGAIDVGLVPSIEYLGGDYRLVPGVAVASDGPVASVALFTRHPIERVSSIALDTSSRTSVALVRVLCARHFGIRPSFVDHGPDLEAMLERADAALVIGDPALFADHSRLGALKIDLGEEWRRFAGLPFVYACWTGRPGCLTPEDVRLLQAARDEGEAAVEAVAASFFPDDPERAAIGGAYLRRNIRFHLGEREAQGLAKFLSLAVEVGAAPAVRPLAWYE